MGCCFSEANEWNGSDNAPPTPKWDELIEPHVLNDLLKLTFVRILGVGSTAHVVCAKNAKGELFAVKIMRSNSLMSQDDEELQRLSNKRTHETSYLESTTGKSFVNELGILQILQTCEVPCDYVEELISSFMTQNECIIITKMYDGGDLYDVITNQHLHFTEQQSAGIAFQLLSALQHLHRLNVVHRDIKPENFVFEPQTRTLKLIDFGEARLVDDSDVVPDYVGSVPYVAPEVVQAQQMTGRSWKQADMWSCGVVVFLLLNGEPPFRGSGRNRSEVERDTVRKIKQGVFSFNEEVRLSQQAKDFVLGLLREPALRMTAKEGLMHPWITSNLDGKTAFHSTSTPSEFVSKDSPVVNRRVIDELKARRDNKLQVKKSRFVASPKPMTRTTVLTDSPDLRAHVSRRSGGRLPSNTGPLFPSTFDDDDDDDLLSVSAGSTTLHDTLLGNEY